MVDKEALTQALEWARKADTLPTRKQLYFDLHIELLDMLIAYDAGNYLQTYKQAYRIAAFAVMILREEYQGGGAGGVDSEEDIIATCEELLQTCGIKFTETPTKHLRMYCIESSAELGAAALNFFSFKLNKMLAAAVTVFSSAVLFANRIQKEVFDDARSKGEGES